MTTSSNPAERSRTGGRPTRRALWLLTAAFVPAWVYATGFSDEFGSPTDRFTLLQGFAAFFVVGAVIVARRPGHPIGWLFAGVGWYAIAGVAVGELTADHIRLYALSQVVFNWFLMLGAIVVFVPLLFPTGRLPSPRWRWVAWPAAVVVGLIAALTILQTQLCVDFDDAVRACRAWVDNPIGLPGIADPETSFIGGVLFGGLLLSVLGALGSVVVRFRTSRGVERLQLKWFTYAVGLLLGFVLVVEVLLADVLGLVDIPTDLPFGVMVGLVPVSAGVAILRYRLFEIDRIISRTVSYGLLTAVLVGVYAAGVFGLGSVVREVVGQSSQAAVVAASTLAVAALFRPARLRIQGTIDRRFNRSRFDAEREVEEFVQRLREEVDLQTVVANLGVAIERTLQPAAVTVWIHGAPR